MCNVIYTTIFVPVVTRREGQYSGHVRDRRARPDAAVCPARAGDPGGDRDGAAGRGDKLPTVRQLAVDLKINANTVAKVYSELERAGVLETRRGVGTFIREAGGRGSAPPDRERLLAALADRFLADAATLGFSADEAINFLKVRWIDMKREQSDG